MRKVYLIGFLILLFSCKGRNCSQRIEEHFSGISTVSFCNNIENIKLKLFKRYVDVAKLQRRRKLVVFKESLFGFYLTRTGEEQSFKLELNKISKDFKD